MLMLADTENEKSKWVMALNELHRILKRNNLPNTMVSTNYANVHLIFGRIFWAEL